MQDRVTQSIQNGRNFLINNQAANGRFSGLVSYDAARFSKSHINDAVFITALILGCLGGVEGTRSICSRAAYYLLSQRSEQWTWNYWERGSTQRPYPDDWDDMACVIFGIHSFDPTLVPAHAQAILARELIGCETTTGGPYRTWCASELSSQWHDVDVVVNANIATMLFGLGVRSKSLETYISECIEHNNLQSPYYIGVVPTLYFISRSYRGSQSARLNELIADQLAQDHLPLQRAMLIAAAYRMGFGEVVADQHIRDLLDLQRDGAWPANALYYEPPKDDMTCYAGSPELTTAFVLEALTLWSDTKHINKKEVSISHKRDEVTSIATIFKRAIAKPISSDIIRGLNKGSELGWSAYTMFDDILDGDSNAHQLSSASKLMRQSVRCFCHALSNDPDFSAYVEQVFDRMDSANSWELSHARNPQHLPDYGNLNQLAERSWGQVLAPTGVLLAVGYQLDSQEVRLAHHFMKHYIIAKQLCDDAHDWQEDLYRGRVTPVVRMVLMGPEHDSLLDQQHYFWEHTILEVNRLIRYHVKKAHDYLIANPAFIKTQELQGWLDAIERSCDRAEAGRDAALQFIDAFAATGLVQ